MMLIGYSRAAEQQGSGALAPLVGDMNLVHTAYVGESLPLDFSDSFAGDITGISPAIPHSISGKTITISPTATSPTTTYTVSAGGKSVQIGMRVLAAPATLAASGTPLSFTVEVDRPIPRQAWYLYHIGGIGPYTYEQTSGPAWMVTRAGGTRGMAPSAPTSASVTVRVTDQRGDFINLSYNVTVIAKRTRSTAKAMQAGDASIRAAIDRMGLGSGGVLYIPASLGAVRAGTLNNLSFNRNNPLIIHGETGATIAVTATTKPDLRGSTGIILENLKFQWQSDPGSGNQWACYIGDHVWAYDCTFEGHTFTVNPNDGQDWENSLTFAYGGKGLRMEGTTYAVAHNCFADKIQEGFYVRGLCQDCSCGDFRDDVTIISNGTLSAAEVDFFVAKAPSGNRFTSEHEDLLQMFSDNGMVSNVEIKGRFSSSEASDSQGMWATHVPFSRGTRTIDQMWQHIYFGDSVFICGTWNGFAFQRWYNFIIENCVVLIHPDASWSKDVRIRHWHASKGVIRNSIFARLDGGEPTEGANGNSYQHLITQQNNRLLPQSNRAAYSTVFPGYENTGLSTFDRMQLNPAWVAANPGVGPAMLRA